MLIATITLKSDFIFNRRVASIVVDGKVMTSQGVGTAICFALEIVKKIKGDDTYQTLKKEILAVC